MCTIYWHDADGDAFGDGTTQQLCGTEVPGPGWVEFVAGLGDCDDANGSVHPGQFQAFSTPRANGSFDYDCDGMEQPDVAVVNTCGDCSMQPVAVACGDSYVECVDYCGTNAYFLCSNYCDSAPATLSVHCR